MTKATHPAASDIKRLQDVAPYVHRFRRDASVIKCPVCTTYLHVYVHGATQASCFFLCAACAFFRTLAPLEAALEHEYKLLHPATHSPGSISRHLDRVLKQAIGYRPRRRLNTRRRA